MTGPEGSADITPCCAHTACSSTPPARPGAAPSVQARVSWALLPMGMLCPAWQHHLALPGPPLGQDLDHPEPTLTAGRNAAMAGRERSFQTLTHHSSAAMALKASLLFLSSPAALQNPSHTDARPAHQQPPMLAITSPHSTATSPRCGAQPHCLLQVLGPARAAGRGSRALASSCSVEAFSVHLGTRPKYAA